MEKQEPFALVETETHASQCIDTPALMEWLAEMEAPEVEVISAHRRDTLRA